MKRTAMLGLLVALSATAKAGQEPPGWRIGGQASFTDFDWSAGPTNVIEDSAIGAKVFAQYRFNSWFALEGAYQNTGDFKDTLVTGVGSYDDGDYKLGFDGLSGNALFFLPDGSEEIDFFLKAGFFDFDSQLDFDGNTTSTSSETGLTAGAGVEIEISENFGLRADLDWFDSDVGDLVGVNIGLQYAFGGSRDSAPAAAPAAAPVAETAPEPAPAEEAPAAQPETAAEGEGATDDAG